MAYHPFASQYTNVFNEAAYNTAPLNFGQNNVNATESHTRRIVDSFSQNIGANPQPQMPSCCCAPKFGTPQAQIVPAQKQYIPGGVSFTFNPSPQNCGFQSFCTSPPPVTVQTSPQQLFQPNQVHQPPVTMQTCHQQLFQPNQVHQPPVTIQTCPQQLFQPNQVPQPPVTIQTGPQQFNPYAIQNPQQLFQPCPQMLPQQPLTLQQQIALKQLETQGLELMLLQENLKRNPYKLQFHYNGQTSTTDLLKGPCQVPASQGMPDFNSLSGVAENLRNEFRTFSPEQSYCNCSPECLSPTTPKTDKLNLKTSPDLQEKQESREKKIFGGANEATSPKTKQRQKNKPKKKISRKGKKGKGRPKRSKPRKQCNLSGSLDSLSVSSANSLESDDEYDYEDEDEDSR